ncbi:MAG: methyltransferase domain-containing protein, partial [Terracidiphilus sp.]
MTFTVSPAARAFDAVAPQFDARFGAWLSVAAQRRAVREALLTAFPRCGQILELGGGTGEDACFLASRGFRVTLTDPSPAMVSIARAKLAP